MNIRNQLMAGAAAISIMLVTQQGAWAQTATTEQEQSPAPAAEQAPAPAAEQAPTATEQQAEPAQQEQAPPATEQQAEPAQQEQAPPATEQQAEPAQQEQAPAANEQQAEPAQQEQAPAATEQQAEPAQQEQAPAANEQQAEPAQQEQAPAATEQQAEQPAKKERKKKQASEEQPAPEGQTAEPAQQEQAPAANEQQAEPAQQEQAPAASKQDAGTAEPQQAVEQDPKPQFTADSVLGDDRAASELTDADLRERIRAAEELSANEQTPRRQRRQLSQKLEADKAELNARIAASTGVAVQNIDVSAKVNEVTGDNRRAAELKDNELRERIQATRGLLALEGLDDRQRKQLRDVLAGDRQEIRSRVAARDGTRRQRNRDEDGDGRNRSDDLPMRGNQLTLRDLLEDDRPADDLTASALERRIDANRRALRLDNLTDRQQQALRERMRSDRQALRTRFGNRRERRRERLNDPAFALAVAAGAVATAVILSRPNIAAAEAYDEEIEDWLTAAPLVETKKRYRVEDFRAQPRLRYAVPGIEVDTVRFGFGEGFLREEEIPKLDRIGATIERIVAGNPDEVFLIEGHTDAVGTEAANMKLSQERAEAVKQMLMEYFNIGDENLATVGRGELYPKIPTQEAEAENRRVSVRRITPLLARN
jgi:outer membrane protein OmpA-like peptidoglycan-associated protein